MPDTIKCQRMQKLAKRNWMYIRKEYFIEPPNTIVSRLGDSIKNLHFVFILFLNVPSMILRNVEENLEVKV